jgi:hypothetical protein
MQIMLSLRKDHAFQFVVVLFYPQITSLLKLALKSKSKWLKYPGEVAHANSWFKASQGENISEIPFQPVSQMKEFQFYNPRYLADVDRRVAGQDGLGKRNARP